MLTTDAAGNLFGTTTQGGPDYHGVVFEIANSPAIGPGLTTGVTDVAAFNPSNGTGAALNGGVIADDNGDLFGTTSAGGTSQAGTVFEVVHGADGYNDAPVILANFNTTNGATPEGDLVADANGDLFGTTTAGGANGFGTVFEIADNAGVYGPLTTLAGFNIEDGYAPSGTLILDARGDLFGTSQFGGTGAGNLFEIVETTAGYDATPIDVANFGVTDSDPEGVLIMDDAGDLFGTTGGNFPYVDATVFEIVKTTTGYASTPTTLASFGPGAGGYGGGPGPALVMDAAGDLFGVTFSDASNDGTVYEIAKNAMTATGYAATPETLLDLSMYSDSDLLLGDRDRLAG